MSSTVPGSKSGELSRSVPIVPRTGVCKARHRPICQLHSSLAFSDGSLASSFSRVENPTRRKL